METRKNKYNYYDEYEDDKDDLEDNYELNNKKKRKNNIIDSNDNIKRKRSNSESDIYYKIKERSKYDIYFKNLKKAEQMEILEKENSIYNYFENQIPIRYKILYSTLPLSTKSLIIQKIDCFEAMDMYDSEYSKLGRWLNSLSKIPFDNYVKMPVCLSDGQVKIQNFLYNSYNILEKTIYGQKNAKNKIMQILAQWISNANSISQIIALEGPPGVGKTSLIKHGVSKALNRPFCFYALGGANDISNLEGHSYTYEGAIYGRMVEMLMESKVMNPVIFFDELDKISECAKGYEINGLLTHLTDSSQNNVFNDKYFSGINIDFSKALFFFSYNDINLINHVLKDRLTIVKFEGYNNEEKINIVKDFIIPDLLKNIGFSKNDINIDSLTIEYIINNFTENEDGVRNIKRKIEDIFLKINLLRLIGNDNKNNLINIEYKLDNLVFPLNITKNIVNNLLSK